MGRTRAGITILLSSPGGKPRRQPCRPLGRTTTFPSRRSPAGGLRNASSPSSRRRTSNGGRRACGMLPRQRGRGAFICSGASLPALHHAPPPSHAPVVAAGIPRHHHLAMKGGPAGSTQQQPCRAARAAGVCVSGRAASPSSARCKQGPVIWCCCCCFSRPLPRCTPSVPYCITPGAARPGRGEGESARSGGVAAHREVLPASRSAAVGRPYPVGQDVASPRGRRAPRSRVPSPRRWRVTLRGKGPRSRGPDCLFCAVASPAHRRRPQHPKCTAGQQASKPKP